MVIILSALTNVGAELATSALKLGALDFVLKPEANDLEQNIAALRRELLPKIEAFRRMRTRRAVGTATPLLRSEATLPRCDTAQRPSSPAVPIEVIAIGISTGGPATLAQMLPRIPADFPVPILIVQHMPPVFTASLASDLDRSCRLRVFETHESQEIRAGAIYIAPGGKQMAVVASGGKVVAKITEDAPIKSCRPSIDYLFYSVATVWGGNSLAVIMTGMGDDGKDGCVELKRHGARIVAQGEESCVIYGMPKAVVDAQLADTVCSLDDLPAVLTRLAERGRTICR